MPAHVSGEGYAHDACGRPCEAAVGEVVGWWRCLSAGVVVVRGEEMRMVECGWFDWRKHRGCGVC